MRNASGQGHGQGQGQRQALSQTGGQAVAQQTPWWQIIDWRILLLAFGGLSIAYTFMLAGHAALKK